MAGNHQDIQVAPLMNHPTLINYFKHADVISHCQMPDRRPRRSGHRAAIEIQELCHCRAGSPLSNLCTDCPLHRGQRALGRRFTRHSLVRAVVIASIRTVSDHGLPDEREVFADHDAYFSNRGLVACGRLADLGESTIKAQPLRETLLSLLSHIMRAQQRVRMPAIDKLSEMALQIARPLQFGQSPGATGASPTKERKHV